MNNKPSKSVEDLYKIEQSDFDTPRSQASSQNRFSNNGITTETQSALVKQINTDRSTQTNSRSYAVNSNSAPKRDNYRDIHKKAEKKPYGKLIGLGVSLLLLIVVGIVLLITLQKKEEPDEIIPSSTSISQVAVIETTTNVISETTGVTNQVEPTLITTATDVTPVGSSGEAEDSVNVIKIVILSVLMVAVVGISIAIIYTILRMEKSSNKNGIPNGMVAYLKLANGSDLISIREIICKLGSSPDLCDQVLNGRYVSKEHAQVIFRDGHFYLLDLGSRNGTFVNDVRINQNEMKHLSNGNSIRFADAEYIFEVMYE